MNHMLQYRTGASNLHLAHACMLWHTMRQSRHSRQARVFLLQKSKQ